MDTNHTILGIVLTIWCIIHSVMIDNKFITFIENKFKSFIRYYRLFYNVTSIISLLPILIFAHSISNVIYFKWDGYFFIIQIFLVLISLILFIAGSRNYDFLQFLGIQQIIYKSVHKSLSKSGDLKKQGILNITRHPWYTAFLIMLWAREINNTSLLVNFIFSLYLVVGTYLEEQKLKIEFGESYIEYQQNVSMLLPVKWIIQYLKDNNVDYVVHYNKTKKRIIDRFMHILVGDFNENNNNFRKPQSKGKHS